MNLRGQEANPGFDHGFRHLFVDQLAVGGDVMRRSQMCNTMGTADAIAMTMIVTAKNFAICPRVVTSEVDEDLLEYGAVSRHTLMPAAPFGN